MPRGGWNKGLTIKDPRVAKYVETRKGFRHSEESKRKISEKHRGMHHSEETKRKMSLSRIGKRKTREHIEKIRLANSREKIKKFCEICKSEFEVFPYRKETAKYCSKKCLDKSKMGHIPWNKNMKNCYSKEVRLKMSKSHAGQISSMKGKHHSEEAKRKMSIARMLSPNRVFKDTVIEQVVAKHLNSLNIKYEKHYPIFGHPDMAIPKKKIAIFVDGCYWHGCKKCFSKPSKKQKKWIKKDVHVNRFLIENRWKVIRIWEHDIKNNNLRDINCLKFLK